MQLLQLLPVLLVLQLLQHRAAADDEEPYMPAFDQDEANINPLYRLHTRLFFHDPHHVNGQIRDRWCQEKCMRHCYCTYGRSCRRSCISYCDRGPYAGSARDPFMHNRSKRSAATTDPPEEVPTIQELSQGTLPYLDGFEYDSRSILRRKDGRPVWNPRAKDIHAKQKRVLDTRWGKLCQDPGN